MRNSTQPLGLSLRLALVAAAVSLLPLAGCNDVLKVDNPDVVTPGQLDDPATLPTVRAGAIGDFSLAYSGDGTVGTNTGTEGIVLYGGLLADEWVNSETFPTRIEVDARHIQVTNATLATWFLNLSRARRAVETAAGRFAALAPDDPGYPEMLSLSGFAYLFFAENFCSGVPISQATFDNRLIYGRPLTTAELLDTAIARFDSALKVSGDAEMTALASVGKGRALLDQGDAAGAAAAVSGVPTTFAYLLEHSENTDRENNGVFKGNVSDQRYSVADGEGVNGLPFLSVPDPRTPYVLDPAETGFDGTTPLFDNLRYGDRKASISLATGVEARLIQAEAALRAGDTLAGSGFYAALNQPRANPAERPYFDNTTRAGTPPIGVLANLAPVDAAVAGGAVNLLFNERARWLWLTAHRLSDLRRLVRQYDRAADAVFPTGPYFKSQQPTYGTDVNFPIPLDEANNPNFAQCLDRNP
jgi:starch-binding outer membrane protein, SusD/RagB family